MDRLETLPGGIRILYEDADVIVCFKPAGTPVQSASMRVKDMVSILKLYILENRESEAVSGEPYIGVVHRLDQPVQGIVLFAKTKSAAASLSAQMTDSKGKKTAQKQYLAVVWADDVPAGKELTDWLLKDAGTNTSRIVPKGTKGAKESRLQYKALARKGKYCLLNILLLTGRHHQIRVQLSGAGMPIVGDQKYGASVQKELLALCAYRLTFFHPRTGKKMEFSVQPEGEVFDIFKE